MVLFNIRRAVTDGAAADEFRSLAHLLDTQDRRLSAAMLAKSEQALAAFSDD